MENASKALVIAGSILIAMLILGIGVYLFAQYSEIGTEYERTLATNQTMSFNEKFYNFQNRTDITAQEIVTLAHFAINYNNPDNPPTVPVEIIVVGSSGVSGHLEIHGSDKLIEFLENNSTEMIIGGGIKVSTFTCTNIKIDDTANDTGRVIQIEFRKN